jgi:hypothetical protein
MHPVAFREINYLVRKYLECVVDANLHLPAAVDRVYGIVTTNQAI